MKNIIYHYGINDLSYSYYFALLKKKLENELKTEDLKFEDILEYIEIIQFGNDSSNDHLIDEIRNYLKNNSKISQIRKLVAKFFSNFSSENMLTFLSNFKKASYQIHEHLRSFIEYFIRNDLYKKLTESDIKSIFENEYLEIEQLCCYKSFVSHFESFIHDFILNNCNLIKLLVNKYDAKDMFDRRTVFLPKFTFNEINNLIKNYLESDFKTNSILMLLHFHKDSENSYKISPDNRILIKKLYLESNERIYNSNQAIRFNIEVILSAEQDEIITSKNDNGCFRVILSQKVLDKIETADQEFGFLFSLLFIDSNHMIGGIYKRNKFSSLFDVLTTTFKDRYGNDSYYFTSNINLGVFSIVYEYLKQKGIYLEDALNEVINNKANNITKANYKLDIRRIGEPDYKALENLFNEMQSLIRQHNVYSKYRKIDNSLIEFDDSEARFDNIKSVFDPKYYEVIPGSEIERIVRLLFSPTEFITDVRGSIKSKNFADFISKNNIEFNAYIKQFPESKIKLNLLLSNAIITVRNNIIDFVSPLKIKLLNIIYECDCLPYFILSKESKYIANGLMRRGYLKKSSSLFSQQELDYLSYLFNDVHFVNSLHLRNKYEHGYGKHIENNIVKQDYFIGLKAVSEIVSKIYDEIIQPHTKKNSK